ncbi:hypothetical protein [Sphingosinicella rhizophila]|uniref:Uncharacterized protein n=1 Tax=Sphingosinicella rhizophila TaxID=3050082 RepID=A0ABU3Q9V7_9SPHN|nr:hypothetical protein [Sphingosinicella sp. GR2756]MDT9600191.1 hypothetical protein [Sphingosinicella sp. GR2756]
MHLPVSRLGRILSIIIAGTCLAAEAKADDLQDKLLAGARATRADSFGFRRTLVIDSSDNPRKVLVEQYDPRRPLAQQWSLISVDGRAPTAKERADARRPKEGRFHPMPNWRSGSARPRPGQTLRAAS